MCRVFLVLILLISGQICSQSTNALTTDEYSLIKVQGVLLSTIETNGCDVDKMNSFFGSAKVTQGEGGMGDDWRNFEFEDDVFFGFINCNSKREVPELIHFQVQKIEIKSIKLRLGDSIDKLGESVVFSLAIDGSKYISFTLGEGDCCPIIIDFDQSTKRVNKISHYVWT